MEGKLLDRLGQSFKVEMPKADTLDGYLDKLLPIVKPWSEDLREEKFYLGRPWVEKQDSDTFHQTILHIFKSDNIYLKSINGDIKCHKWEIVPINKFLILTKEDHDALDCEGELFDLAFLDAQFFILKKHGDQARLGNRKYFVMVTEGLSRMEWRDLMEVLFKKSQSNVSFYILITIAVLFALAILVLLR